MDRKMINNKGFTLVEVMIVVAIVGVVSAIAISNFSRLSQNARIDEDMHKISTFLKSNRLTAFTVKNNINIDTNIAGDTITATIDPGGANTPGGSILLKTLIAPVNTTFTINSRGLFAGAGAINLATVNISAPYSCVAFTAERVRRGEWDGANCAVK